ncbi:uncharacterized protein [Amphiura filiformis]|uniref:uncharacterized protein n=1 Tax=Amphiura filiformis TaxID=82378 RepID=UPI003B219412
MYIKMINHVILLIIVVSLPNMIHGQQDNQQQTGSCTCPCPSAILNGPAGPTGLPGVQGPQGLTVIGPVGNPGMNGIPGVPGQAGNPGQIGNPGAKGEKGDLGQGSTGQPGDPGPKGEQGLVGTPGFRGSPGKVGPIGIPGLQGLEGNEGQTGVKGDKGEPGTSYTAPPTSAFSARITANQQVTSGSQTVVHLMLRILILEMISILALVCSHVTYRDCTISHLHYFLFIILILMFSCYKTTVPRPRSITSQVVGTSCKVRVLSYPCRLVMRSNSGLIQQHTLLTRIQSPVYSMATSSTQCKLTSTMHAMHIIQLKSAQKETQLL